MFSEGIFNQSFGFHLVSLTSALMGYRMAIFPFFLTLISPITFPPNLSKTLSEMGLVLMPAMVLKPYEYHSAIALSSK